MCLIEEKISKRKEFQETIYPFMDDIFSATFRLTQSLVEAETLTEETFAKAWSAFHQFERGTNIRAWLYRIMTSEAMLNYNRIQEKSNPNIVTTKLRKDFYVYNKLVDTFAQQQENLTKNLMATLSEKNILNALKSLSNGFREAVIMVDMQELSCEDAALALNISIETVRSRLNEGRYYFQKALWDNLVEPIGREVLWPTHLLK
ncbi:hypothetical protein BVX98_05280 [bacterium F11]|nr:hypothetical protein BVX98_05280 [bacterium F11]